MAIETTIVNTTKDVILNLTNHISNNLPNITNHITNNLPNDTINVSVQTSDRWGFLTAIGTIILAIGTIALAVIAFVQFRRTDRITRKSNENTEKSNELYRSEIIARLRPMFSFEDPNIRIMDNIDRNSFLFVCRIKNIGTVPVTNVRIHHVIDSLDITPKILLSNEEEIKMKSEYIIEGTLEPQRYNSFTSPFNMMPPQNDVWIALWINYEYLDDIKEESVAVFHFQRPIEQMNVSGSVGFVWHSHKDMENTRKSFKKNGK